MLRLYIQILLRAWGIVAIVSRLPSSPAPLSPPISETLLAAAQNQLPMGGQLPFLRHGRNLRTQEKAALSDAAGWNVACFMYVRHNRNVTAAGTAREEKMNPYISKLHKALFGYNTALKILARRASRIVLQATLPRDVMQRLMRLLLHPVSTLFLICVVLLGGHCLAQEVDVPGGRGSGSVVAPSGWVELIAPVQKRIDLKLYGFYIGEVEAPSAQFDATFRATKFLSITPSYLYYSVPASGLNELANHSRGFTRSFEEHQFRIDGTVNFSIHKFEISDRNMYVRRFLAPNDINRYRNQIAVAHPLAVKGHVWKPFASYEAFYDQGSGWTKNRTRAGVTVPFAKHVSFQPSYMWEGTKGTKDLNYLMLGLIFRTPTSR